ncbi:MAG: hypothetical protein KF715_05510 [Candidatus Didemnitutus sp.]|nr:hypothetical protein [Candidatus Didemnitutus sp.]
MLGAGDPAQLAPVVRKGVEAHLENIERTLEHSDYFEAGFPCWSSVPYLLRRFAGRVRVVHLLRHPVATAYSWWSHGAYQPQLLPRLPQKILLHPGDAGVAFPEYAQRWAHLHPVECSLYYWTEVNAFARSLEKTAGVPWLRLDHSDLFSEAGLRRLCAFLGAEYSPRLRANAGRVIDEHHFFVSSWIEPDFVSHHPTTVDLARQLGYDALAVDAAALRRRFAPFLS